MTEYIGITEAQSNPFAPLTSELVKQLRDNPIALAEGAEGAPGIYARALENLQPGSEIRTREDAETSAFAFVVHMTRDFSQYGTVRFRFEHVNDYFDTDRPDNGSRARIRRIRNTVTTTVFDETVFSTVGLGGYVVQNVDLAVRPGDRFILEHIRVDQNSSLMRNARIQTDGQDLWPGVQAKLEGNRNAT